ncbi:MAG: hypothetical protein JXA13_09780 [Anaerolineales bacterium]|nr:hypothetical protein [Anaerolineales bacterium]
MQINRFLYFLLCGLLFPIAFLPQVVVFAQSDYGFTENQVMLQFPDLATFQAEISSDSEIMDVTLEYGTYQQSCGNVVAKAFPQFSPGKTIRVQWTWEMKQSGSIPPGATIWWQWRYINAAGQEELSQQKTITWLDDTHTWRTIDEDNIRLHWYSGDNTFSSELHQAAVASLELLEHDAGLVTDQSIDLYIYANTSDMQDAILYEPSWTGGMAYPDFNIVIIGISPRDMEWGKNTEVHELTHVLVGHQTFSCLGDVPTWLNEGLAVYSEGGLDHASQNRLEAAIRDDTLFSVRSLSGSFSEIPDKADLSYSESYSIVNFLIKEYGRDKMTALLLRLRDGTTIDSALQEIYGFNIEGLEDAWRAGISAQPRSQVPNPTPTPQPTFVPTIVPFSGILPAVSPTPVSIPTPEKLPVGSFGSQPLTLMLLILATCCILVVLLLVIILAVILRKNRKGDQR